MPARTIRRKFLPPQLNADPLRCPRLFPQPHSAHLTVHRGVPRRRTLAEAWKLYVQQCLEAENLFNSRYWIIQLKRSGPMARLFGSTGSIVKRQKLNFNCHYLPLKCGSVPPPSSGYCLSSSSLSSIIPMKTVSSLSTDRLPCQPRRGVVNEGIPRATRSACHYCHKHTTSHGRPVTVSLSGN